MKNKTQSIEKFDEKLLLKIFGYLNGKDIPPVTQVSKKLNTLYKKTNHAKLGKLLSGSNIKNLDNAILESILASAKRHKLTASNFLQKLEEDTEIPTLVLKLVALIASTFVFFDGYNYSRKEPEKCIIPLEYNPCELLATPFSIPLCMLISIASLLIFSLALKDLIYAPTNYINSPCSKQEILRFNKYVLPHVGINEKLDENKPISKKDFSIKMESLKQKIEAHKPQLLDYIKSRPVNSPVILTTNDGKFILSDTLTKTLFLSIMKYNETATKEQKIEIKGRNKTNIQLNALFVKNKGSEAISSSQAKEEEKEEVTNTM